MDKTNVVFFVIGLSGLTYGVISENRGRQAEHYKHQAAIEERTAKDEALGLRLELDETLVSLRKEQQRVLRLDAELTRRMCDSGELTCCD